MKNSLHKNDENQKCIWMSAGIISYKLCNCKFKCDTCAFDKVMLLQDNFGVAEKACLPELKRTETANATDSLINQYLSSFLSDIKIHLNRFHHPSHCWYKIESEEVVTVGVNKLLLKILEPSQQLHLPEVGEEYEQGQEIACISRNSMNIPLHTAVKGKIIDVNNKGVEDAHESNTEKEVYHFKMEVNHIKEGIEQLCTSICGLQYFIDMISLLKKYLRHTFQWYESTNLGVTVADGGRVQVCLEKVLGEEEYQKLLEELIL